MSISEQLKSAIARQGLTLYQAAQIIGAETDEPLKTIHQRLARHTGSSPISVQQLEQLCEHLGLEVVILPK